MQCALLALPARGNPFTISFHHVTLPGSVVLDDSSEPSLSAFRPGLVHVNPQTRSQFVRTQEILATETPLSLFIQPSHPSRTGHHTKRQSRCKYQHASESEKEHDAWRARRLSMQKYFFLGCVDGCAAMVDECRKFVTVCNRTTYPPKKKVE